jgi:hypothetical protein
VAEHRSTAEEAADPGTSPERLLELTERHPQLHRLIVMNPSTPDVARQWILATNPWAKQAFETDGTAAPAETPDGEPAEDPASVALDEDDDLDAGEPTQAHQVVPDEEPATGPTPTAPAVLTGSTDSTDATDESSTPAAGSAAPSEEPGTDASAGDEVPEELVWGAAGTSAAEESAAPATPAAPAPDPSVQPPAAQTSPSPGVRLSPNASVVPLGAAPAAQPPAARPDASGPSETSAQPYSYSQTDPYGQSGPSAQSGSPAQSESSAQSSDHGRLGPAPHHGPAAGADNGIAVGQSAVAGQSAAPLPYDEQDDADDGGRKMAWIACGGCLVLALVLLAVIGLGARALLSPPEDEYQRDSSTTSAEAPSEETTDEATTEEPSEDPVSPAPEDAEEMGELLSPTGNISCLLEEDSVSCSVVDRDFSEAGLEDCENGPFSITVAGEEAERACGTSFLSDSAQTLEYDRSAKRGDVACTSRFDGMTCWNTMTGKGFTVNRVGYETF